MPLYMTGLPHHPCACSTHPPLSSQAEESTTRRFDNGAGLLAPSLPAMYNSRRSVSHLHQSLSAHSEQEQQLTGNSTEPLLAQKRVLTRHVNAPCACVTYCAYLHPGADQRERV